MHHYDWLLESAIKMIESLERSAAPRGNDMDDDIEQTLKALEQIKQVKRPGETIDQTVDRMIKQAGNKMEMPVQHDLRVTIESWGRPLLWKINFYQRFTTKDPFHQQGWLFNVIPARPDVSISIELDVKRRVRSIQAHGHAGGWTNVLMQTDNEGLKAMLSSAAWWWCLDFGHLASVPIGCARIMVVPGKERLQLDRDRENECFKWVGGWQIGPEPVVIKPAEQKAKIIVRTPETGLVAVPAGGSAA
jgi:hypothetical protein